MLALCFFTTVSSAFCIAFAFLYFASSERIYRQATAGGCAADSLALFACLTAFAMPHKKRLESFGRDRRVEAEESAAGGVSVVT